MNSLAVSPRMRRMQWMAVGLATAAIALNYIDRSTLAIANLTIRQEFGISATAIGALQSFWSLTYACCQIPVGFLLDRLGPRYLVGLALLAWSAAQAAGGLAGTGASDLARFVFGSPATAYAAVFGMEAALFLAAAWLAMGVFQTRDAERDDGPALRPAVGRAVQAG